MKNKCGFTIIEIIFVIGIIALVSVTSTIIFNETTKNINEERYEEILEEIRLATDVYLNTHPGHIESLYNGTTNEICTKLYVIQNEGLLEWDLKNPKTNEFVERNKCIYSRLDTDGNIVHDISEIL